MINISIIENIYTFISSCPFLEKQEDYSYTTINVDYLGNIPTTYSIDLTPSSSWVKKYLNGSGIKKRQFSLLSTQRYGEENKDNLSNLIFYEKLEKWIEEANKDLPFSYWTEIKTNTNGYMFIAEEGQDQAIYQIQIELQYLD